MTDEPGKLERLQMRGLTLVWGLMLVGGITLMFALTQWGLLDDVSRTDAAVLAVGAANGMGVIAFGGWNAIGIVAIGGANAIGIVSIGGLNSIGVISFGGLNAVGGTRSVRFFAWSPTRTRGGKPV